jgi:ankyrin repeat protein
LTKFEKTPLHLAAGEGRFDAMMLLIDVGANLNAKDKVSAHSNFICCSYVCRSFISVNSSELTRSFLWYEF